MTKIALNELSLLIISLSVIGGALPYLYIRKKMVHSIVHRYTKSRILKVSFAYMSIMLYALLLVTTNLVGILLSGTVPYTDGTIVLSLLIVLMLGITMFGAGMYTVSILAEAYTTTTLKHSSGFEKLHLAIYLSHGPISHIFMNSGYIIIFFLLSILSSILHISGNELVPLFQIIGIIFGVLFGVAQIANGTALFQYTTTTTCFLIYCALAFINPDLLVFNSNSAFFVWASIVQSGVLGLYIFQRLLRKQPYYWYMPVDIFAPRYRSPFKRH